MSKGSAPKVFISYSWDSDEHKHQVKVFAEKLKKTTDFEIAFDAFINLTPDGGWITWMKNQINEADFVILVCTERYKDLFDGNEFPNEPDTGKGVKWESRLVYKNIYNQVKDISSFVPVFLNNEDQIYTPDILDCSTYNMDNDEFDTLCENIRGKWKERSNQPARSVELVVDIKNTPATQQLKKFLKSMNTELLKKLAYPYLPTSYFGTLPENNDEIIDAVISVGPLKAELPPPLLCTLKELNERKPHKIIEDYIEYLYKVKYQTARVLQCSKSDHDLSECSFVMNFERGDGREDYSISTWRYADNKFKQILIDRFDSLQSFFDALFKYADEMQSIYQSNIFFEIVLPDDELFKNIKNWKNSNDYSLIRKYKYYVRLQSRFLQPDTNWKAKWESLKPEKNSTLLCADNNIIKSSPYNKDLTAKHQVAIFERSIDNPEQLLIDLIEFGIPVLILPLATTCSITNLREQYKEQKIQIKESKEKICSYMMDNHNNDYSDLLFLFDDYNKIPDDFKKPEQNLYGW